MSERQAEEARDWINSLSFDRDGLIPCIVQDAASKAVLMMAFMNRESLNKTLDTKETWFWSRSRQSLWHKGATSGNRQEVISLALDCDQDTLLVKVKPKGPACHQGTYTCFTGVSGSAVTADDADRFQVINALEAVIAQRDAERPEGAYTTYLFEKGIDKILKKVGEEAGEVIIAAKNHSHEEMRWEVSDLLYHLLVLLREEKLPLDDVLATLRERHQEK